MAEELKELKDLASVHFWHHDNLAVHDDCVHVGAASTVDHRVQETRIPAAWNAPTTLSATSMDMGGVPRLGECIAWTVVVPG